MSKVKQRADVGMEGFNAFKNPLITDNLSHLLGEILTIIDASIEGDKNTAVKDLIRDKFGKTQSWFSELAWKELLPEGQGHSPARDWENQLVPLIYVDSKGKSYCFKW